MNRLHRAIHSIFYMLFGDFNGVQVFLYPLTLFWWIDSKSFLYAVTGLLTNQKHFFPLCLFLLLMLYVAFLIIKNSSSIFSDAKANKAQRNSFYRMVIGVHKTLLIWFVCMALIYVLSYFLKYYYGIQIPLKAIYPYVLRFFSIFLIVFYVLKNTWTLPYREHGSSMEVAAIKVRKDLNKQPTKYLIHAVALLLLMMMGAYIYNQMVVNLFFPLVQALGVAPKLILLAPLSFASLIYDVFIFGVAFMLSNILFSPLMVLIMYYSNKVHPYNPARTEHQNG